MNPLRAVARHVGRQRWVAAVGTHLAAVDRALQRATGGVISFGLATGLTPVLLTTTGRTTGRQRTTPLIAIPDDGSLLLIGSNWGKPGHPGWSANLIANPHATVEFRGRPFPVTATQLTGEERTRAWAKTVESWPGYGDYAARTTREIRIFRITRD
jgi:deazaflavin-dependent oxidoreductase (nitroreductase family)